ncbi:unnamed protein product [Pedinophyceae sp. YPF-701]|nr:unnamed protein product [Pedinophyceae sp. YPF-701]
MPVQQRGPRAAGGFAATCALAAGTLYWYKTERERILRQRIEKSGGKTVGKALIGGPFELVDSRDGKTPFSDRDLLGEFSLLYFGFTHCPDICPDELEKICEAANLVERQVGVKVQLVFITIDPQRDHAKQVKAYCEEFHPRLIGLTGNEEAVARACRAYRVYHHRTNDDPKDYLVDHSIITYCLDPQGSFLAFYGKNSTKEDVAKSLVELIQAYAKDHPEYTVPKPA